MPGKNGTSFRHRKRVLYIGSTGAVHNYCMYILRTSLIFTVVPRINRLKIMGLRSTPKLWRVRQLYNPTRAVIVDCARSNEIP